MMFLTVHRAVVCSSSEMTAHAWSVSGGSPWVKPNTCCWFHLKPNFVQEWTGNEAESRSRPTPSWLPVKVQNHLVLLDALTCPNPHHPPPPQSPFLPPMSWTSQLLPLHQLSHPSMSETVQSESLSWAVVRVCSSLHQNHRCSAGSLHHLNTGSRSPSFRRERLSELNRRRLKRIVEICWYKLNYYTEIWRKRLLVFSQTHPQSQSSAADPRWQREYKSLKYEKTSRL